jgi:hypothetical protein
VTFSGGSAANVSVSFDGGAPVNVIPVHGQGVSTACFGWPPGVRGARVTIIQGSSVAQTHIVGL